MSWKLITDDWRLKLLGVGLAILMLGAVAFSQNPPTTRTLNKGLSYTTGPNVLISPPASTTVTITGLADVIGPVTAANLSAKVDASHAKPGPAVRLDVSVTTTIRGVTVQEPPPIVVDVDTLTTKEVPVEVKANAAPGWSISTAVATCPGASKPNPCAVHFTGPATWMNSLHAYVTFPGLVAANKTDSPNQPVLLQNNNGFFDYNSCGKVTTPACGIDVTTVSVHVEAVAGSTSSTVALLDSAPSRPPASGFRVTGVTITPSTVIISGDPVTLAKIRNIVLPAVDLSGKTADFTAQVQIAYPGGTSGTVGTASVTYSISRNPNVSPSPSPSP